ncbi:Hypothetical predicted protein [Octopus vulgaris]|uniref:Secreted protein n=1 Tax=Octopus vulgaris TaxID=6645 RepID=A0AA36AVA4_OCTVU|nr:Hypothetical predicted protein [Octopus vulgaris]
MSNKMALRLTLLIALLAIGPAIPMVIYSKLVVLNIPAIQLDKILCGEEWPSETYIAQRSANEIRNKMRCIVCLHHSYHMKYKFRFNSHVIHIKTKSNRFMIQGLKLTTDISFRSVKLDLKLLIIKKKSM